MKMPWWQIRDDVLINQIVPRILRQFKSGLIATTLFEYVIDKPRIPNQICQTWRHGYDSEYANNKNQRNASELDGEIISSPPKSP